MKRIKCTYADRYKAIKAPTCGCKTCEDKWAMRPTEEMYLGKGWDDACMRARPLC